MQDELYVRVKQALTWLKRNKGILQKDIADKMGMAEASFTRALARIKEKNDEDFVITFHSVVSKYISLDYLLYGNGTLECQEVIKSEPILPSAHIDPSSQVNATISAYIEAIESLKRELRRADEQLAEKDARLAEKDERIAELKAHNIDLRRQLDHYQNADIGQYPFPIGAAEDGNRKQLRK